MNLTQIINSVIFIIAFHHCTILTSAKEFTSKDVFKDLSKYVIPLHYNLNLSVIIQEKIWEDKYKDFLISGQCSITINILRPTQNIKLHALNLVMNSQVTMLIRYKIYYPHRLSTLRNNVLDLYFLDVLSPGIYILKMNLLNLIRDDNTENLCKSSHIKDKEYTMWLIAPQIQMAGTRGLFPCWDEPLLRTTFTISIQHNNKLKALSNMPIKSQKLEDPEFDFAWTHFYTTPPLSTYQVSIVLTSFPRIQINDIDYMWCKTCSRYLQSLLYAKQIIKDITLHLTYEFTKVKIPKIDYIVLPNVPNNFTTKWGLIFYREADLVYNEHLDPVMRKIEIARNIAVKIVQQWFGDTDNLDWYFITQLLHKSFAILFGEEAIVKIFNNPKMMDLFIVQNQYESHNLNSYRNTLEKSDSSEIDKMFSYYYFPHYMRTLIYLRMIQNIFINVVFWRAVNTYVYFYMFAPVNNNPEFWLMEAEKSKLISIPIEFSTWLSHKRIPVVCVEERPSGLLLTQAKNSCLTVIPTLLWLPTYIMTKTAYNYPTKVWLTPEDSFQFLGHVNPDEWKIIDIQQAGYYRINYTSENWHKLVHFLNSTDRTRISVISRAKMIDDTFYFMITKRLNASIFWNLTKYLSQETDYAVWYPMIKAFEYMSIAFPLSEDKINFNCITEQIRELLANSLKRLGYEERSMENILDKCLRQELAKWACALKHPECLNMTRLKYERHLSDPKFVKILPGWKEWTYCNGVKNADTYKWKYLRKIWPYGLNITNVGFIHCFHDDPMTNVVVRFLNYNRWNETRENITKKEIVTCINLFYSFVAMHAKNNHTLLTILKKFFEIKPREISTVAAVIVIINNVYSTNQLYKVKYFLKTDLLDLEKLRPTALDKVITRESQIKTHINNFYVLLSSNKFDCRDEIIPYDGKEIYHDPDEFLFILGKHYLYSKDKEPYLKDALRHNLVFFNVNIANILILIIWIW